MKLIFKTFEEHEQQKKPGRKLGKGLNKVFLKMTSRQWGIEAYASIPSSWIAGAGGSLQVRGQPGLHSKILP